VTSRIVTPLTGRVFMDPLFGIWEPEKQSSIIFIFGSIYVSGKALDSILMVVLLGSNSWAQCCLYAQ
jgi:hypothetical protein